MTTEGQLPHFVKMLPDGRMALTMDNHLIQTYTDCPAKFHLRHIQRFTPKGMGGAAMNIGGWWSAVLEDLYNHMMTSGHRPSINEFIEMAGKRWADGNMDRLATEKPKAYKQFGGAGGAVKMAFEYYQKQVLIDLGNWKIIGAELGFGRMQEVKLYEDGKLVIYYMGKPDLVVSENGKLFPVEHKTVDRIQSSTHLKYKPHPQITGYVYSINEVARSLGYDSFVDRCIVNIASRMPPAEKPSDGVRKPRFLRVFPNYSEAELLEWKSNTVGKIKRIYNSLINNEWLLNDGNNCHLYAGCEYRRVHAVPALVREIVLKSDYNQAEAWSPYLTQEEEMEDE